MTNTELAQQLIENVSVATMADLIAWLNERRKAEEERRENELSKAKQAAECGRFASAERHERQADIHSAKHRAYCETMRALREIMKHEQV